MRANCFKDILFLWANKKFIKEYYKLSNSPIPGTEQSLKKYRNRKSNLQISLES
jgi:hypothetical protein